MTSMWERGSQCQYPGTALAAVCLSDDRLSLAVWPEQEWLSSTGSPP